jgi:hypothetical protein
MNKETQTLLLYRIASNKSETGLWEVSTNTQIATLRYLHSNEQIILNSIVLIFNFVFLTTNIRNITVKRRAYEKEQKKSL